MTNASTAARRAAFLRPTLLPAAACALAAVLGAILPAQDAPDASALERDLKKAMSAQDFALATTLATQLLEVGGAGAVETVAQVAFTGASYDVEKAVGGALAAATDPAVRAKVLELARHDKNSRPKSRVILIAIVARYAAGDAASLSVLHGALKDPSRPVVFAALQRIRDLKKPESVAPLARELTAREKKGRDRIYHDIVNTLQHITGASLEVAADWENYAATQRRPESAPAPSAAVKSSGKTSVFKRPSFFSMEVDSDRVLFVIDVSGSMTERDPEVPQVAKEPEVEETPEEETQKSGTTVVVKKKKPAEAKKAPQPAGPPPANRERMYRVKEELARVIGSLPQNTRFGILSFSHELAWWGTTAGTLKEATPGNKSSAAAWVRGLLPSGATRTDLALEAALAMPEIDTIYLLTDGAPKDENDTRLDIEPILARAKERNRFLRARIHTISFAQIRDTRMRTFVARLAKENDGMTTWLP